MASMTNREQGWKNEMDAMTSEATAWQKKIDDVIPVLLNVKNKNINVPVPNPNLDTSEIVRNQIDELDGVILKLTKERMAHKKEFEELMSKYRGEFQNCEREASEKGLGIDDSEFKAGDW